MDWRTCCGAIVAAVVLAHSAGAGDSATYLNGTWTNADAATGGIVKVAVTTTAGKASIQAWGNCHPTPCDWGAVPLQLLGDTVGATTLPYGLAEWKQGFATQTMTLRREDAELVVETYTVFHNDSKRTNYRQTYRFALEKP